MSFEEKRLAEPGGCRIPLRLDSSTGDQPLKCSPSTKKYVSLLAMPSKLKVSVVPVSKAYHAVFHERPLLADTTEGTVRDSCFLSVKWQ